jgi:hypothetical protein
MTTEYFRGPYDWSATASDPEFVRRQWWRLVRREGMTLRAEPNVIVFSDGDYDARNFMHPMDSCRQE